MYPLSIVVTLRQYSLRFPYTQRAFTVNANTQSTIAQLYSIVEAEIAIAPGLQEIIGNKQWTLYYGTRRLSPNSSARISSIAGGDQPGLNFQRITLLF